VGGNRQVSSDAPFGYRVSQAPRHELMNDRIALCRRVGLLPFWLSIRTTRSRLLTFRVLVAILIVLSSGQGALAYSVLTHEEIVDLVWEDQLRPLILQRYPGLSEDQIKEAHAYAYGGAVIQDLGYYPFGSAEFSDLVHYVRTGDFVRELLAQSRDANEYAFALGALSHYASDIAGHPAVNHSVAIEYPKLRAKFGPSVTYAQGKTAHLKTEFGFDVVQVAKNRYASRQYHDFIGFKVSTRLLERVFPIVYGLELKAVLPREGLAIGSYRYSVSQVIPEMTQVALQTRKNEITGERSDFAKREFLYRLSRSEYEKEWGKDYQRPGLGARFLSALLRFVPKVGPFKGLGFATPTPQTEDLYIKSINVTVERYRILLEELRANKTATLQNYDLDTGNPTKPREYSLTDETYAKLLTQLAKNKFDLTTSELRDNIIQFYSTSPTPTGTTKEAAQLQGDLLALRQADSPVPATHQH